MERRRPNRGVVAAALAACVTLAVCTEISPALGQWQLADTLRQQGRCEEAIAEYNRATQLDPMLADAYQGRGFCYDALGDYEQALRDYDDAIRLLPSAPAYSDRGVTYTNLGKYERAIQDFDEAIRLKPSNALYYTNRAVAYADLGQFARAIEDNDEALKLDRSFPLAYFNRAADHRELGRYERAIGDYSELIRLQPDFGAGKAYVQRGITYLLAERDSEANADFDRARQLGYTDAEIQASLAEVKRRGPSP